jgi:hypothetical protein
MSENFENLTIEEIDYKISQKQKAKEDLSIWLGKHAANEAEYQGVLDDRAELSADITKLQKRKLHIEGKAFKRSLNQEIE